MTIGWSLVLPARWRTLGGSQLRDPPRVLHRAGRTNDHPIVISLESGPQRGLTLNQIHNDVRIHRALDRGAAGFPFALAIVSIPDREQGPLDVDAQVRGRARPCLLYTSDAADDLT